jgi:hypothetical protein
MLKPIKHCRDFNIEWCSSCIDRIYGHCSISKWRDIIDGTRSHLKKLSVVDLISIHNNFQVGVNPVWFLTAIECYYPEMYIEFNKLITLL